MRKVSRLLKAAKVAGVGVQARNIWDEHPYLKEVTEAVIEHFDGFDSGITKLPLVENAVLDAVSSYIISTKNENDDAMVNYLAGLFASLPLACEQSATTGAAHWMPDLDQSFLKFRECGAVAYKMILKNEPSKIRQSLLKKFILDEESIKIVSSCRTALKWDFKNG